MANLEFSDKHNMVAYLEQSEGSEGFHEIINFLNRSHIKYAFTKNLTMYVSFIKQFWRTATANTRTDGKVEITATIDGHVKTINEASLRRHLKLEDNKSETSLLNSEIFEQLALMGPKKTSWEQFSSNVATAIICLAINRTYNFFKMIFDAMGYTGVEVPLFSSMLNAPSTSPSRITSSPKPSPQHISPNALSTSQPQHSQPPHAAEEHVPTPHDSPLHSVHSHESGEGRLQQTELTDLVTQLFNRISVLEKDLQQTKKTYSTALTKLILKVKKLEIKVKAGKARRRTKIILSEDKDAAEDFSKQGRKISNIDEDPNIFLAQDEGVTKGKPTELVQDQGSGEKGQPNVSTANTALDTAKVSISTAAIHISTASITHSTAGRIVYGRRSAEMKKDKGKAIMTELEPQKKSKKQLEQERLGYEEVVRLQEQINEEERAKVARDAEIARQLQEEINLRPRSVAEVRKNMCVYLKNQGGYKMTDLKGMSYDDIRPIFEKVWDQVHDFVPMDSEFKSQIRLKRRSQEVQEEPETKQLEEEVQQEDVVAEQKQKLDEEETADYEKEKEDLRMWLTAVSDEEAIMDPEVLHTRLVMERFKDNTPEGYSLILWGDLKTMFEPNSEDEVWRNQQDWNLISWKLYENCGVHTLLLDGTLIGFYMLVEKRYPFTKETLEKMLNWKLEAEAKSTMAFELLKFVKTQIKEQ
ncbi:hypothetical protein Tco_1332100 [Tanacetum coccineum]